MLKSETKFSGQGLTQEAFDVLLARLHSDREQAGQKYELLRLRLNYFFESRACSMPDSLVDETINRLAHKIRAGEAVREVEAFALAIARFVWLEAQKEDFTVSLEEMLIHTQLENALASPNNDASWEQDRFEIMRQCLMQLPPAKLELLRAYYQAQGATQTEQRRQLARAMGTTENALYLKIHRLRQRLIEALTNRMKDSGHERK